jgi:iron(III) transport system substrate-binding protein
MALAAASCGGDEKGTAQPAAAAGYPQPTYPAYADLVAKAKQEGQLVVVAGPEGVGADGDFYKAFTDKYGLKLTLVGGAADEVNTKILAERQQGRYTVDISGQGSNGTTRLLEAHAFAPLEPLMVDPEIKDRSTNWRLDYIPWEDDTKEFCTDLAVEAQLNFAILWYNTDRVSKQDIDGLKSWKDLLNPKWHGKIVMGDISSGEQNADVANVWMVLGQSWFDSMLRDQKTAVLPFGSGRELADGLARGDYDFAMFPAGEDSLQAAKDDGLPVASLDHTMAEGSARAPIQRLCAMDKAPHPAATQLFVNWSMSREGQAAFNEHTHRTGRVAVRNDVPQGKIARDTWDLAQKGGTVIDPHDPKFNKAEQESIPYLKQLFKQLNITPGA